MKLKTSSSIFLTNKMRTSFIYLSNEQNVQQMNGHFYLLHRIINVPRLFDIRHFVYIFCIFTLHIFHKDQKIRIETF